MKIGFCGLGQMGFPIARRLLDDGNDLVVWNRSPEKAVPLVEAGALGAGSPAETAAGVDAVITMLSSPEALEDVVLGDNGIATRIGPGSTLVEMSTVGPDAVRGVAARLPERVEVVDAPVLGSVPEAETGALKVFVGGSDESFERVRRLLSPLGNLLHVGEFGAGAAMKLVVNSTLGALQLAFAEAMALSDALGLDPDESLEVLEGSAIGGTVRKKREKLETGIFDPNFKLALAAKDMRLVVDAARAHGIELRVADAARAAFEAADRAGFGDLDYSAVVAFMTDRAARRS
jgi:3-hydroxyisobutyrate dehydrogenase-like beta-hydroxyacid dehydrogenase